MGYKMYWRCCDDGTFAEWKQNIAQFIKVMFKVKVKNAPIRFKLDGVWNQCCSRSKLNMLPSGNLVEVIYALVDNETRVVQGQI